jgi:short-subunit dehydrogenase
MQDTPEAAGFRRRGTLRDSGPHADQLSDDVRQTLIANLLAPMELTRQVLPPMIKNGRGTVVNVSSLVAETPLPNTASYATSKAGLTQFTLNLQLELRKTPVTALLVIPGSILGTASSGTPHN